MDIVSARIIIEPMTLNACRWFVVALLSAGIAQTGWVAESKGTNAAATKATNKTEEVKIPALTLPQALRTNVPGTYKFAPALTGLCARVIATGSFTAPEPAAFATNWPALRFDAVVVTPKRAVGNVGPKGLARIEKEGGYSALHALRDELPTDSEIRAAGEKGLGALQRLLGPPHGFPATTGVGEDPRVRSSWAYCVLNKEGAVETLEVTAITARRAKPSDASVEALEVKRGNASPEPLRKK